MTAEGASALGSTFLAAEPERDASAPLRERGARYVPAIGERASSGRSRACARPVALDGRPLIGARAGGRRACVAAGNGPWGISTGPASARLIADLMLGRRAPIPAALDPARFGAPPAKLARAVGSRRTPALAIRARAASCPALAEGGEAGRRDEVVDGTSASVRSAPTVDWRPADHDAGATRSIRSLAA